jgi:hypothetical protein
MQAIHSHLLIVCGGLAFVLPPGGSVDPVQEGRSDADLGDLVHPPEATAAGSSEQKNDGLTCKNKWHNTWGGTKCTGNNGVKWRLRVACKWQGDYRGPWNDGPGSDGFECTFGVQSASVEWG